MRVPPQDFIPAWRGVQGKPFVVVTPNGPTDGGDFGPQTAGTTTAGIQEAINSLPAGGGCVSLNSGTYNITSTIKIPSNVLLCGASDGSSQITSSNTALTFIQVNDGASNVEISHVYLNGGYSGTTQTASHTGISCNPTTTAVTRFVYVHHCIIGLFGGYGILFNGTATNYMDACSVSYCNIYRCQTAGIATVGQNFSDFDFVGNYVTGGSISGTPMECLLLQGIQTSSVIGGSYVNAKNGIDVPANSYGKWNAFEGVRCYGNSNYGFWGQSLTNSTISGSFVNNAVKDAIFDVGCSFITMKGAITNAGLFSYAGSFFVNQGIAGLSQASPASITVGTSPFTYTNTDPYPELVVISGGTLSAVALKRGTTTSASAAGDQIIYLIPNDSVVVTYTSAPTMEKFPL